MQTLRNEVVDYCLRLGADPLLVQGAGGNVSWKEQGTLWIKASGTRLAAAAQQDIFVAVDLTHLEAAIETGDFAVTPQVCGATTLKPSIETLLHALMPYPIVVHVHAVDILACLVRRSCESELKALLNSDFHWTIVDYHKPGQALAAAVAQALKKNPAADIVFLKNHGVVIGGATVDAVEDLLHRLTSACARGNHRPLSTALAAASKVVAGYCLYPDTEIQNLALNEQLFAHLTDHWALYPDHVVFLGEHAHAYNSESEFQAYVSAASPLPKLIFIRQQGVYTTADFNLNQQAQLRCYYDVLSRQTAPADLQSLSQADIDALLNWEAEHYRVNLSHQS